MTPLESAITHPHYRPLPGHCVIQFDAPPTMSGLIHIPATADQSPKLINRDKAWVGRVLYMTPKKSKPQKRCSHCGGSGTMESAYEKAGLKVECCCLLIPTEQFWEGDRVVVMLGVGDLDKLVIQTPNTRVYAVVLNVPVTQELPPPGEGPVTTTFTSDLS